MGLIHVRLLHAHVMRERLLLARTSLPLLLGGVVQKTVQLGAAYLGASAPIGPEDNRPPLIGDAPGHLKDSFSAESTGDLSAIVLTSQPVKLRIVVEGRGAIYPRYKKALFWPGLAHPVPMAGPAAPNDFVSEAIDQTLLEAQLSLNDVVEEIVNILEGA